MSRGIGPARQSAVLGMSASFAALRGHNVDPVSSGEPLGIRSAIVCGSFWMTRELEIGCAQIQHLTVDVGHLAIDWCLPASKTDVKALGKLRRWECVCTGLDDVPCPVHAVLDQLRLLEAKFGAARVSGSWPVFPSASGAFVDKRQVVLSLEHVATLIGEPLVDISGIRRFGGHSLRVTGARTMAALGIELVLIQLMARWSSDVVLRYVADAPLASITASYRAKLAAGDAVSSSSSPGGPSFQMQVLCSDVRSLAAQVNAIAGSSSACSRTVDYLKEELTMLKAKSDAMRPAPCLQVIVNQDSGIGHKPLVWASDVPPHTWRTECGWAFGLGSSTWVAAGPESLATRCRTCFRAARQVSHLTATSQEATSSSSRSSSP